MITGSLLGSVDMDMSAVVDVKWNTADHLVAIGCASPHYSIRIVDAETGLSIYTLMGHTLSPKAIAWDPRNPFALMTGGRDGSIHLWDLHSEHRYRNSYTQGAHEDWE